MNAAAVTTIYQDDETFIPRFRMAGEVTLDLFHRDGRVEDRWLGFHPREFELLWRLAESPGEPITRKQLLSDVWRIDYEPETNSLAVHVARVRAKLSAFGMADILATHPEGGYLLDAPSTAGLFRFETES